MEREQEKIVVTPSEPPVLPSPVPVAEPEPAVGKVFAKTDFSGVAQTSYVRLSIADLRNPDKSYQLFIGDKSRQRSYAWKVERTVMPSYFFIELPPSLYKFHLISIPVGTATADESMDIVFEVTENRTNYLGTLKVSGIEEKIRFGGIPVIKPGFDYRVQVSDDRDTAIKVFHQRYPKEQQPIDVRLMQVNLPSNFEPERPTKIFN